MNQDLFTGIVLALGMVLYGLVCIPVFKWIARTLTGRSFQWRLQPRYPKQEGQWRDIAWSSAALLATMLLLFGVMELLGLGPAG